MFQTYKNQSTDSQSKSIDWFPYDENTSHYWVSPFIPRLRDAFRTQSKIYGRAFFAKIVNGFLAVNYFRKKSSAVDIQLCSKCTSDTLIIHFTARREVFIRGVSRTLSNV